MSSIFLNIWIRIKVDKRHVKFNTYENVCFMEGFRIHKIFDKSRFFFRSEILPPASFQFKIHPFTWRTLCTLSCERFFRPHRTQSSSTCCSKHTHTRTYIRLSLFLSGESRSVRDRDMSLCQLKFQSQSYNWLHPFLGRHALWMSKHRSATLFFHMAAARNWKLWLCKRHPFPRGALPQLLCPLLINPEYRRG